MYLYLKELVFWVICICTGQSGGVQEGIQGAENVWLAFLRGRVEHPSSARWQNLAHIMNMFFCTFPSFVFVLKCILYSLYNILAGFSYIISSVRSSNSHPDLLVIQQHHPLFLITSVLDKHIGLSFFEPSGDDLGTTFANLGKTQAYSGILWHTLAYSGKLLHTLAYSCILWHTLGYSWILWHTLAYSGIHWRTLAYLAYSCILWHTIAYSGILWHTLAYSGMLLHTLA